MRAHLAIAVALVVQACLSTQPAAAAGWAVGTGGTILKSVDGGTSWTAQNPITAELRDLHFIDDTTGWAVGLNGTILKTTNAGVNWTASNPTTAALNAVFFISSTTGWAVGSGGAVLKTTNGGTSWTSTFPTTATLNAVHFVDANTGWAVGTGGAIFKTTNGGANWTGTFPSTATFNGVFFISSTTGCVVGTGGNIFKTTNGGTNWTGTNPTTATLNGVTFVNTNTGWAVGTAGAIFKTTNGGTSWTSLNPVTATLNGVAFLDANTGWIAGSIGTVLKTTSAGGAWTATNPTGATLNAVQFVSAPTFVDVTVATNPTGLAIMVDGTVYVGTQSFSWLAGASHTIATTTPQGARYVFANWSDGGAISHAVAPTAAATYTANFTRQYQLTMNAGAGGTVAPATGWQNAGASVAINATPNAGFSFGGWTASGSGSYSGSNNPATVTMNGSITQTASFVANITVTVNTSPAGRSFSIDGTTYATAQTLGWVPGQAHTIATTSPQSGATGTRYVWASWSDAGALSHTVAPMAGTTYTASFATQHQLTMLAGPGGTVSPPTGWQAAGSSVAISATPDAGHQFGGWAGSGAGAYSGADNPASVTMNGPVTQQASFTVPAATEYFDHTVFQGASPWVATVGFDGLDAGDGALSGGEFAALGLTILQRDALPMNLLRAGVDNPSITLADANSPPDVLSSSASSGGQQDISDNFDFIFATPVLAAGIWVGNLSIGSTEVQFLDASGALIAGEALDSSHAGVVGAGSDCRMFYGIISSQPIQRIRTVEGSGDGDGVVYDDVQFAIDPTGIGEASPVLGFALLPPSPNPSRGMTQFAFSLPEAGAVALEVFDLRGRLVDSLVDGQCQAGTHLYTWRGTDRGGAPAANGVYLVRLRSADLTQTRRALLLR